MVMPCCNAEKTVGNVIDRIPKGVADKVIAVDDGSHDKTFTLIRSKGVQVIKHRKNRGYGGAQKTLFKVALNDDAGIIVLLHQDGQYPPEHIPKLIAPLLHGECDLVLGPRENMLQGGMPLIKYVGNRVLTFLENKALGLKLQEYHTGFRAYSSQVLKQINFDSFTDDFHFDTEILIEAARRKLKIAEVPTITYYGEEVSTLPAKRMLSYGISILYLIVKYKLSRRRSNS